MPASRCATASALRESVLKHRLWAWMMLGYRLAKSNTTTGFT